MVPGTRSATERARSWATIASVPNGRWSPCASQEPTGTITLSKPAATKSPVFSSS